MATATQATKIGNYKGRQYRVLFCGQTKFGLRAHLEFTDGSKDFWVDGRLVSIGSSPSDSGSHAGPPTPASTASPARKSGMASDKQMTTLRKMLGRLSRVSMFDSMGGDGDSAAESIRAEIREAGDTLTSRKASELISRIDSMIDDEM